MEKGEEGEKWLLLIGKQIKLLSQKVSSMIVFEFCYSIIII